MICAFSRTSILAIVCIYLTHPAFAHVSDSKAKNNIPAAQFTEMKQTESQGSPDKAFLHDPVFFDRYKLAITSADQTVRHKILQSLTELGLRYQHGQGVARDRVKAVELYKIAAEAGYALAQKLLADCYADHLGIGVPSDPRLAMEWYEKAADQGLPEAKNALGKYYQDGLSNPKNIIKAAELYKQAAQAGVPEAMYRLGRIHAFGIDDLTAPNRKKEAYFLLKAARLNDLKAMFSLTLQFEGHDALPTSYANALYWAKKYDELSKRKADISEVESVEFAKEIEKFNNYSASAIPDSYEYKKWSRSSRPEDWYNIGQRYWKSDGQGNALELAAEWFAKAADANYAPAMTALAFCYLIGIGVKTDETQAFRLFQKAGELGDPEAQDFTGFCYEYGIGAPENMQKAIEWYAMAAENGNPESRFAMAFRYMTGWGVKKDEQKALELYQSGEKAGDQRSINALANCYEKGIGVPKDLTKAWFWYKQSYDRFGMGNQDFTAKKWLDTHNFDGSSRLSDDDKKLMERANAGDGHAMGSLGRQYLIKNNASDEDVRNGIAWLQKGADAGDDFSMGWLAHYYQVGWGVPKSLEKSFELYKQLAEMKNNHYAMIIARCYEDGIGVERDRSKAIMWYKKAAAAGNQDAELELEELER